MYFNDFLNLIRNKCQTLVQPMYSQFPTEFGRTAMAASPLTNAYINRLVGEWQRGGKWQAALGGVGSLPRLWVLLSLSVLLLLMFLGSGDFGDFGVFCSACGAARRVCFRNVHSNVGCGCRLGWVPSNCIACDGIRTGGGWAIQLVNIRDQLLIHLHAMSLSLRN